MNIDVTVIDYERGNLLSVSRALEHCGARVQIAKTEADVKKAGHLVLPGVGAFGGAMKQLDVQGLIGPLKDHVTSGRPLLGICLGMQILLDRGEEFGAHDGLGLIQGDVLEIPATRPNGMPQKRPHIGWSPTIPAKDHDWRNTILEGMETETDFYFVHSFAASLVNDAHCLATTNYNGHMLTAVIQHENLIGVQFHPEKSGPTGLKLLERFIYLD